MLALYGVGERGGEDGAEGVWGNSGVANRADNKPNDQLSPLVSNTLATNITVVNINDQD